VRCNLKSKAIKKTGALALLLALGCARLPACGPNFPNNLLAGSDYTLLVPPAADFSKELARLRTSPAAFHAVTNGDHGSSRSAELELADLAAALQQSGRPDPLAQAICASHRLQREKLGNYLRAVEVSNDSRPLNYDPETGHAVRGEATVPMPPFPEVFTAGGLPDEFADYFEGAVAWAKPEGAGNEAARTAWERLLARPENERRFKSTWAAFMLGKSWAAEDPEKAAGYFRQVRALARHGFLDSTGLAAASLGEEARVWLNQGKLEGAVELYLEQYATGDSMAVNSLRIVAAKAVNIEDAETLRSLAANPGVQPVITAYLISRRVFEDPPSAETNVAQRWLAAVEAANVRDVASAEKLALAAYQAGDWESAQRWIDRAPSTPAAQWLQAKLLLRSGKTGAAAALLAKVARSFPPAPPSTNAPAQLFDNLTVEGSTYLCQEVDAAAQVSGELGVFRLARREYTEALDVLMRAGFWEDAAYVAERVLTADELRDYVARNWPVPTIVNTNSNGDRDWWTLPQDPGPEIRGLLARRLARLNRAVEAREYFTPPLQADYDTLEQALAKGWDTALPAGERADAFYAAAKMTRTNGLELFATELEPDWHIHGAVYAFGFEVSSRTNEFAKLLPASDDELRRAAASAPNPDTRFHYRFLAAAMAWQAALLMPDNSDATARVLCEAGTWIKYRDPERADVFYKALVRRCRKTAIGDQADKMRWFPVLDANGNPIPYTPHPAN